MSESSPAIVSKQEGDLTVVRFAASTVKANEYTIRASQELVRLAQETGEKVLFTLENVQFMSSFAIAALVSFNRTLRERGCELKVCCVPPEIRKVFKATQIDRTLELFDSREKALAAFGPNT